MTSITQLKFCDCSQLNMTAGRTLQVEFAHEDKTGETIFIMVDRRNLLQTALDEASCLHDFRKPSEVQIYNEVMFFLLILSGLLQQNTLAHCDLMCFCLTLLKTYVSLGFFGRAKIGSRRTESLISAQGISLATVTMMPQTSQLSWMEGLTPAAGALSLQGMSEGVLRILRIL